MERSEREAIAWGWRVVAEDALKAAEGLRVSGFYRSSVSLAGALVLNASITFRDDREGPEHEPLSDLVADHLNKAFSQTSRQSIRLGIRVLYGMRIEADYRPRSSIRSEKAVEALQIATTIANNVRKSRPR